MVKKIKRETVTDAVIGHLVDLVASQVWRPGDRLPGELDLARQLGVGRTSVREALKVLQVLGVVTRGNEGTFVSDPLPVGLLDELLRTDATSSRASPAHLYEARRIVEGEIAWLAVQSCDDAAIRDLESIYERMRSLPSDAIDAYLDLDLSFHRRLCEVVGNPILTKMWSVVSGALTDRRREAKLERRTRLPKVESGVHRSIHAPLIDAMKRGDAEAAREVIHVVLGQMEQAFEANPEEEAGPPPPAVADGCNVDSTVVDRPASTPVSMPIRD